MSPVSILFTKINGMQNVRQLKKDNQWRLNNRQDLFTHPRYFLWKPVPQQMYMSPKASLIPAPMPISYNRYGFPHMAASPMHHQSYMFALPLPTTNQKTYPYQAVKEIGDKRKPGNIHHITIINAVIPKPHFPPPTPPTTQNFSFQKFRHNKQLYHHPYLNTQTGWPNISRIPIIAQQQYHNQVKQPVFENAHPTVSSTMMANSFKHENNMYSEKKSNVFPCSKSDDSIQVATNYFCNYFTNIQNSSLQREGQQQHVLSTVPAPSTSQKPEIDNTTQTVFLPTPVRANITVQSTVMTASNFVTYLPLKQNQEPIANIKSTQGSLVLNPVQHQHSFFTIEDAITKATPINHVFNNPLEAYIHARNHQHHYIKPQGYIKDNVRTTKNSFFQNFFDDDTFDSLETQNVDDYSIHDNSYQENGTPMSYYSYKNENRATIHNKINNRIQKHNLINTNFGHSQNKSTDSDQYQYFSTTPHNHIPTIKSKTTTDHPYIFNTGSGKETTQKTTIPTRSQDNRLSASERVNDCQSSDSCINRKFFPQDGTFARNRTVTTTTPFPTTTTNGYIDEEKLVETTTNIIPNRIYTTFATSTTTNENKIKKINLKRPYYHVLASANKYQKSVRGLFKPYKNLTTSTTTSATPFTKKTHKYHRQYKSKKNKHLKYSLPTSSTSTELATSTVGTTEKTITTPNRIMSTTSTQAPPTRLQQTNKQRTSKTQSRHSKRILDPKPTEKSSEISAARKRGKNKSRRRSNTTETVKTTQNTTVSKISSTTISQTATTTNRSAMRVHNSEPRLKHSKTLTTNTVPNETYDNIQFSGNKQSSKSHDLLSAKDGNVPPLPIEIYFKKSQHAKI